MATATANPLRSGIARNMVSAAMEASNKQAYIDSTTFSVDDRLLDDAAFGYNDPKAAEAAIIESSRADFESTFKPNEDNLLEYINNDALHEQTAEEAGQRAGESFDLTRGEFNRALSRSGETLTAENKTATDRSSALAKLKGIASGENLTRRETSEMNTDAKGDLISIGRGIAGASASNATSAANNVRALESANKASKAQSKANLISTGVGIAALALMV